VTVLVNVRVLDVTDVGDTVLVSVVDSVVPQVVAKSPATKSAAVELRFIS
jgi:hypothetical protein